jgi:DNA polymerase I-like protein with 3'-5' exonuclease and polymerase domains
MHIELRNQPFEFIPWTPELGHVFDQPYSFDTETTLIDDDHPWNTPGYVLGAVCDGRQGFFIQRQHVLPFLKAHPHVPIVFHNAPFDLAVLQLVVGPQIDVYEAVEQNLAWDTQLLHKLLKLGTEGHVARGKGQSTLETCTRTYLDVELPKDTVDSDGDPVRLSYSKWLNKPPSQIEPVYLEYLAKDAAATILVFHELQAELDAMLHARQDAFGFISEDWLDEQIQRWGPQTHHIQLQGAIVLREITANGLNIDLSAVEPLREGLLNLQADLLTKLRGYGYLPGEAGNQKALQAILTKIERKQPGLLPRTATGKIETKESTLQELRGVEPFIDDYLEYKAVGKLLSTYLDKMAKPALHPEFNPLVESGRTSCFGAINAQNLPRDDRVRSCFVPSAGHVFINADYSTLELGTLAQTVQIQQRLPSRMAELINAGTDLHRALAARVTGKRLSEITSADRQKAKAINFGKPGGMGTQGLVRYAKNSYGVVLSEDEAKDIENAWLCEYPEMEKYLNNRVTAGLELAHLVELTPAEYAEQTGNVGFLWGDNSDERLKILGWMCLKVLGDAVPAYKDGRPYREAEIDYFWSKLEGLLDWLPEKLHGKIRNREPSMDLYRQVKGELEKAPVFTATGRLRAEAGYCQQRNTPFQGLAADGAKLALWKLWRAGFRIVNFIHDEVMIEVPETSNLGFETERIRYLMQAGMREVVPDVAVGVEYGISLRWLKSGGVSIDALGRIAPGLAA